MREPVAWQAAAAQANRLGSDTRASNAGAVVDVMQYVRRYAGKKQDQGGPHYKHREANSFLQIDFG